MNLNRRNFLFGSAAAAALAGCATTKKGVRTLKEGEKPKTSRTPMFPAEWQDQFGLPYNEHRQSMQINIFDGYAIIAVKEENGADDEEAPPPSTGLVPTGASVTDGGNA